LDAARIAHSVFAYDRATEEAGVELPIPLFLDTLALKIARVPPEDKYGALSYLLDDRAVETFRFLLGLAVELLTQVTPHPRYVRTAKPRISERELVVPTLRLLENDNRGWMATSDMIADLTELFAPSGQDAKILEGRRDTYFSQKVRNMISHRDQPSSFIHRGLARYEQHGLRISDQGRSTVQALLS
jgi:hypothetical protein